MQASILVCVLLAALLHASWNALVKVGSDGLVRLAIINLTASLCAIPLLFLTSFPAPQSWPYLLASILIHQAYYIFLVQSYRFGDLSLVYPIARGVAPALVAIGGYIFAAETLTIYGVFAVTLISAAILSLALEPGKKAPKAALFFALGTGMSIAAYTICDGLGGRLSGDVFGYIAWLFFLEGPPIFLFALWRRRGALTTTLRENALLGFAGGLLAILAYGLVIWAMSTSPMTYVSALRETSVLFAAFIGARMMREGAMMRRMLAAITVVCGVVLLQLS